MPPLGMHLFLCTCALVLLAACAEASEASPAARQAAARTDDSDDARMSSPSSPCSCSCDSSRELVVLSRAVLAACTAPAVSTSPQLAAACALAATHSLEQSDKSRPSTPGAGNPHPPKPPQRPRPSLSSQPPPPSISVLAMHHPGARSIDGGSGAHPTPFLEYRPRGRRSMPAPKLIPHELTDSGRQQRQERRLLRRDPILGNSCSGSTKRAVLASLKEKCAISGGLWTATPLAPVQSWFYPDGTWFEDDIVLEVKDVSSLQLLPRDHTACPSLVGSCTVGFHLNATSAVQPESLENAATLLGIWQSNASVTLRGHWGADGLSTVLQHAYKLTELDAASAHVTHLTSDTFEKTTLLHTLVLSRNKMTAIDTGVFSKLTALQTLSLADNALATVPSDTLHHCVALTLLALRANLFNFTDADVNLFHRLSALESLDLAQNHIDRLPEGIFSGLSSLERLDISGNHLTAVATTTFQGLSALERLELQENNLTCLPNGTFQGLTALKALHVYKNALGNLETTVFRGLSALEDLQLNDNRVIRLQAGLFEGLSSLKTLYFQSNKLVAIDATVFHGLATLDNLDLSFNRLALLSSSLFQNLSSLSKLYVYSNKLANFDSTSLQGLSALQLLDLGGNAFNRLKDGIMVIPPQLVSLSQLWLDDYDTSPVSGLKELCLKTNASLRYLNVNGSRQLRNVRLAAGSKVAVADVTGTAIQLTSLPCDRLGYKALAARHMPHIRTLDILRKCLGSEREFLDVSRNDERSVQAVRDALAHEAASFLQGNQSWVLYPDKTPVRDRLIEIILVGSSVQCSIDMVQQHVYRDSNTTATDDVPHHEPLQVYSCSCIKGYHERNGKCHRDVPFAATIGGIVTIMLTTLLAVGLVVIFKGGRKRLRHARHDLEMQRGLLEYAETEVLALRRVWELDADDITLVKRIDEDNEGAFGAVWRGDWDGMVVAVKVLRAGLLELDSKLAEEFEREAEFLMRARHSNVVRFFGAGRMPGGEPFVVLELVARGSLCKLLRGSSSSRLDGALKRRLALDVIRGMAYIHSLGALHRDLKSDNVLVTENWRGKVADFGSMRTLLAAAAAGSGSKADDSVSSFSGQRSAVSSRLSHVREMTLTAGVGTPMYMAPEVLRGDDYGEAADVWAFGVTVWEVVEQRTPDLLAEVGNEGRGPLLGRMLKEIEAGKRLRLRTDAPAWAPRIVTECMEAEASQRPSFAAMQEWMRAGRPELV